MADTSSLMGVFNQDAVAITGGTMAGVTITGGSIGGYSISNLPTQITTSTTPASGTCACQFVFKNTAGAAIASPFASQLYFSNSTGLAIANVTSAAVLTNGALAELKIGYVDFFVTTAAGLLGVTVTAGAGTYYISFILPNGAIVTSSAIVVN